ncbi:MAG TPA: ATP-binding protein [Streptosporangiaceae bacterium]|nr:ATP-binding protein [Streptosporangiaceae bacterium]
MAATTPAATGARHTDERRTRHADMRSPDALLAPAPVLVGSLTVAGRTKNVAEARAFVAKTLGVRHPCADVAVLLCSELVTNAVLHSDSGEPGGTVTVVVLNLSGAVRVEVIDNGSASRTPVVKSEVYVPDGHGLFLVEQLADTWGYNRDEVGTTVWFRLTC